MDKKLRQLEEEQRRLAAEIDKTNRRINTGSSSDSGKGSLLGVDRDAPLPFLDVGIQERVPMVHPAQSADGSALVEQGLGKGGLACVHVGKDAQHQLLHALSSRGEL